MRLIPLLTAAQEEHGHLSEPVLRDLARAANVPLHRLQQLVSFYPHFRTTPPPRVELAVCRDVSCHLAGIPKLKELHGGDVEVHEVSCIGRCDRAPAGLLNGTPVHLGDADVVRQWVAGEAPTFELPPPRRWGLDPYPTPRDRYAAIRMLRSDPASADRMIAEVKASGLR